MKKNFPSPQFNNIVFRFILFLSLLFLAITLGWDHLFGKVLYGLNLISFNAQDHPIWTFFLKTVCIVIYYLLVFLSIKIFIYIPRIHRKDFVDAIKRLLKSISSPLVEALKFFFKPLSDKGLRSDIPSWIASLIITAIMVANTHFAHGYQTFFNWAVVITVIFGLLISLYRIDQENTKDHS